MLRTHVTEILGDYPRAIAAFESHFPDSQWSSSWSTLRAQIMDDLAAGRVPDTGTEAIRYLNQVVDTVSEYRAADIYEMPDYCCSDDTRASIAAGDNLGGLQAESILVGYLSGEPFSAAKRYVSHVLNQLVAARFTLCSEAERATFYFMDPSTYTETERALHAALEEGRVSPEHRASGATIERGSISETLFHRRHNQDSGWYHLPTGQEPYSCCAVNPDSRDIAFYGEGDYSVIHCGTDSIFKAELTESITFNMRATGRVEPGEILGINSRILDVVPELRADLERAEAALASPVPGA